MIPTDKIIAAAMTGNFAYASNATLQTNEQINRFVKYVNEVLANYRVSNAFTYCKHFLVVPEYVADGKLEAGKVRKFVKLVNITVSHDDSIQSNDVHSFIDIASGDIYKPASYKAPAKHSRGNISSPDFCGVITPAGSIVYLK